MEIFVKLYIPIISIIFSSVSLVLSICNFCKDLSHLDFKVERIFSNKGENNIFLMINLIISNKSKTPITINNVEITAKNQNYVNAPSKIFLGGTGLSFGSEQIEWNQYTIKTPVRLDSFDSITGTIMFVLPIDTTLPEKIELTFNTSRGKKILNLSKYNID